MNLALNKNSPLGGWREMLGGVVEGPLERPYTHPT